MTLKLLNMVVINRLHFKTSLSYILNEGLVINIFYWLGRDHMFFTPLLHSITAVFGGRLPTVWMRRLKSHGKQPNLKITRTHKRELFLNYQLVLSTIISHIYKWINIISITFCWKKANLKASIKLWGLLFLCFIKVHNSLLANLLVLLLLRWLSSCNKQMIWSKVTKRQECWFGFQK